MKNNRKRKTKLFYAPMILGASVLGSAVQALASAPLAAPTPTNSDTSNYRFMEAEAGQMLGQATVYTDEATSGNSAVAYLHGVNAGVAFDNLPAAQLFTVVYASEHSGSISYRINGVDAGDIPFQATGGWTGVDQYQSVSINADIPDNARLEIINLGEGDLAMNVDSVSIGQHPASGICSDLELPVEHLRPTAGYDWGNFAGDFTVQTTEGPWQLSEHFSGCDSYVFFNHLGDEPTTRLRNSLDETLFTRSAKNVHWFFLNSDLDPVAGAQAWQSRIEAALAALTPEEATYWSKRIHIVTQMTGTIAGSVGSFFTQHPTARVAAIDRFQQWEDPGLTRIPQMVDGVYQFDYYAPVLAYPPRWYNFRYQQERELAAQAPAVTEVVLMDEQVFPPDGPPGPHGVFANNFNHKAWTAVFPDAATMAEFDTMEVVVTGKCGPSPRLDCGRWDYEAYVHWCDNASCDGELNEVFRWITPYARPGVRKWVFNATPMLGLVKAGGAQHFRFGMRWNMNPSTWDMRFRLSKTGQDGASRDVIPAFVGNEGFNESYNSHWTPVTFTPSADAKKVELVALISGHGQDDGNCAEWCEHQHEFTVNDETIYVREFSGEVEDFRCAEAVDKGVVPGQWGNWTPGRAGWCPGQQVQPWVVDITDNITLDTPNTLRYKGRFEGEPVTGNRGRILLSSYIVVYE